MKQMEVRIDRTSPSTRIGFDLDMRKIAVSGSDELSEVTMKREEEDISPKRKSWRNIFSWIPDQPSMRRSGGRNDKARVRVNVKLSDEAGHVTDVTFTEERKYGTSFSLSNFVVVQNGNALESSGIFASYHAIPGRWGRIILSFRLI